MTRQITGTRSIMVFFSAQRIAVATFVLALVVAAGCKKKEQAIVPLPIAEAPETVEKAFQQAPVEVRQAATQAIVAMRENNDSQAFFELQELAARPELTQAQRDAAVRSCMAVNERLRAAAAKGDKKAEEALEHYRATK